MKKKGIVSLVLVLFVVLSMLSASLAEEAVPVTLTLLTYDGAKGPDDVLLIQKQVDAYMEKNPHVTINIDMQSENNSVEFQSKLDLMQLAGLNADIVILPGYAAYEERAKNGFFAPLDELLASEGTTYDSQYDYPAAVDGAVYGLPYNPTIYHVLINQTMLNEAGLEVPTLDWTWEDYAEYARAMTVGEGANKIYGSYMHTWVEYRREGLFNSRLGNPYVNDDGSSNMEDPNLRAWLEFIAKLENDDRVQIPYVDAKATSMAYRDVFFQGKAAMILTGGWIYTDINNTEQFPHDFVTAFAPFPRWADGPAGRTQAGCSYYSVAKKSANSQEAYNFIRWMTDEGAKTVGLFPSLKGADSSSVVDDKIAGFEHLYDVDSLKAVWNNPDLQPNNITKNLEHFTELDDLFNTESEMFITGGQDLNTTMDNLITGADAILN